MRVLHVIAGLTEADGGPSVTLPELWKHLDDVGLGIHAFTTRDDDETMPEAVLHHTSYRLTVARRTFPKTWKYSSELAENLESEMPEADLCHNHGCWLHPNWIAGRLSRRFGKPLVISPLGHLDEWSLNYHPWRKRLLRALVEDRNWRYASAFVAKTEEEAAQLRQLGLRQTIRVIPNGMDAAHYREGASPEAFLARYPELRGHRLLLFLSRVHPKKGLPLLLWAWDILAPRFPDWRLVIAGDLESPHGREVTRSATSGTLHGRVTLTGPLDGPLRDSARAAASLFVLPSLSENFGQAILEALAAGLPALITTACPWTGVESRGCGWRVRPSQGALRHTLAQAMSLPASKLRTMGHRGQEWVLRDFDWKTIARQLRDLYSEILAERTPSAP